MLINSKDMQYRLNSYGTNRYNKRKNDSIIVGILTIISLSFFACDVDHSISNGNKPPFIVDDWIDSTDTLTTKPDSVWDMTHADSIRFGLIGPDK